MKHIVGAVKTGPSPHDSAELSLYTVAEHAKLCPSCPDHGETVTPEQNARQVVFFLTQHLDKETLAHIKEAL